MNNIGSQARRCIATGLVLLLHAVSVPAFAEVDDATSWQRIALIIGNARYSDVVGKLPSPENDVDAMLAELSKYGFSVVALKNSKKNEMQTEISRFGLQIQKGGTFAIFYYSGHGGGADAEYLMPVDIRGVSTIQQDGISIPQLLEQIKQQRSGHTVAILDSCRNQVSVDGRTKNLVPYANVPIDSAALTKPGTTVMYAAGLNQVAIDQLNMSSPSRNSLYTRFFLERIRENPADSFANVLNKVAADVRGITGGSVVPGFYNEGGGLDALRLVSPSPQPAVRDSSSTRPVRMVTRKDRRVCEPIDWICQEKREGAAPKPIQ